MVGSPAVRVLLAFAVVLALAAPAQADVIRVAAPGPGPRATDSVTVVRTGPSSAKRVLLLVPGYVGGAGDFALVAKDIVARVPGLQVWALDRRSNALEDTRAFRAALDGRFTLQQMLDYYIGWIGNPNAPADHYQPLDAAKVKYAKHWGLAQSLEDIRQVVFLAKNKGKRVILGGHSLGASTTLAYASWDFAGSPGYRDLEGLVLIDGGLLGSFASSDLARTKRLLAEMDKKGPFEDLLGLGLPWAAGAFAEIGAIAALKDPAGPSIGQAYPLLPPQFKPPVPATNRGLLGYAFDHGTSPKSLALIHVNAGQLAPVGEPRDWADGEVTPIARLARTFATEPANGIEWYFPTKLRIDVDAVSPLRRTPATSYLGLRPFHRAAVDLPLYAMQTNLTRGRVLRGARRFVAGSRSPRARAVYVDASRTMSHLDPLTAAPADNDFLRTVVPFLRRLR